MVRCALTVNPTSVVLEVYGDSGYFLSPYFPSKYHANHNLTYTAYLDTPGPLTLRLVLQLDLESDRNICYDYVKIYDIKYCGQGSLTKDSRCFSLLTSVVSDINIS